MDELVFRIPGIRMAGEVLVSVRFQAPWDRLADASVPVDSSHTPSQRLAFSLRRDLAGAGLAGVDMVLRSTG
jgi:hypothetical protein